MSVLHSPACPQAGMIRCCRLEEFNFCSLQFLDFLTFCLFSMTISIQMNVAGFGRSLSSDKEFYFMHIICCTCSFVSGCFFQNLLSSFDAHHNTVILLDFRLSWMLYFELNAIVSQVNCCQTLIAGAEFFFSRCLCTEWIIIFGGKITDRVFIIWITMDGWKEGTSGR